MREGAAPLPRGLHSLAQFENAGVTRFRPTPRARSGFAVRFVLTDAYASDGLGNGPGATPGP